MKNHQKIMKNINFHCKKTSNLENFNLHIGWLIFVDQKWTKIHEKSRICIKNVRCFLSVPVISLVENQFYSFDFGTGSFGNTVIYLLQKLTKIHEKSRIFIQKVRCFLSVPVVSLLKNRKMMYPAPKRKIYV